MATIKVTAAVTELVATGWTSALIQCKGPLPINVFQGTPTQDTGKAGGPFPNVSQIPDGDGYLLLPGAAVSLPHAGEVIGAGAINAVVATGAGDSYAMVTSVP